MIPFRTATRRADNALLALPLLAVLLAARPARAAVNVHPDTCAALPPAADTLNGRVFAILKAPARKDTLPSSYLDQVLDGFRQGLVLPRPLELPAYGAFIAGGRGVMVPVVLGEVEFTLDPVGSVSDIHLTQSTLSPAFDRNLYDAPRRADSLKAFPPQIGIALQQKIRFFIALSSAETDGYPLELFALRLPAWRPGSQASVDPRQDYQPVFPLSARAAGVGDSVSIEFVVDEHGVPIKTTMRLLSAQYIDYARLVVDAALKSRYTPAALGTCPVKGLLRRSWRMTMTITH
jgi:hypothetical protein